VQCYEDEDVSSGPSPRSPDYTYRRYPDSNRVVIIVLRERGEISHTFEEYIPRGYVIDHGVERSFLLRRAQERSRKE
jgi:hypothetical protein